MSRLRAQLRLSRPGFGLETNLELGDGVTALFGPSGAGKTTVLRCISGLERAARGRVEFDGECWQDDARGVFMPAHRRRCGYVFQEPSLFAHLSARGNLEYGYARTPAAERRFGPAQVASLLGLERLLPRPAGELSGGERQRVAIGRALLAGPRLLLMDEPLASLDAPRKAEILYYVERLRDELRLPIVYVSHSLEEVVRLADTVVLMSEGRVLGTGTVRDMMGRVELRPYLGRHEGGAVIEAQVVAQDLESGLARLEFAGGALEIPDLEGLPGERVRVRVRARDVSICLSRPQGISIRNVLAGTVAELGPPDGSSLDVRLDLRGTALLARITRKSAEELALRPRLPVYALIKAVSIDRRSTGYA